MSTNQTQSLEERDGIPYGIIYGKIGAQLDGTEPTNLQESEPPRWNQPELIRLFRRLGTVPADHSAEQATLRVLLAATEMADAHDIDPSTVYADLMRFTDENDSQGQCLETPLCAQCIVRDHCRHASRTPRMTDLPASERPRERLFARGEEHLTDAELLAILIGGGHRDGTALDLARESLATFGNLRAMSAAGNQELESIKGVGPAKIARIRSAFELGRRLAGERIETGMAIKGSQQVFKHFHDRLIDKKQEVFLCLLLDTRHRVIREDKVSVGSLNESVVHPREVFRKALKESAHAVLFVHNHPSGDPSPSPQDKQLTDRLEKAGTLMGIKVLDHMIIGRDRYFSFAEQGEMNG